MTVGELKKLLGAYKKGDPVIISSDSEGNSFSTIGSIANAAIWDIGPRGEVDPVDKDKPGAIPCLILYPNT
jgi:hypothetical protein